MSRHCGSLTESRSIFRKIHRRHPQADGRPFLLSRHTQALLRKWPSCRQRNRSGILFLKKEIVGGPRDLTVPVSPEVVSLSKSLRFSLVVSSAVYQVFHGKHVLTSSSVGIVNI